MRKVVICLLAGAACLNAAQAEIVYQNSKDNPADNEVSYNGRLEFGDQITLEGGERWITGFSFEYFADFTATGDETARLRFYANDGGYGQNASQMPGTLLLDTGEFGLQSGYKTATLQGLAFEISGSFTWTVEFSGLAETERAGLLIDGNVEIGSSEASFWENRAEGWRAVELPGLSANFIAQVTAEYGPPRILPASLQLSSGTAQVEVRTVPGRFYTLEFATAIGAGWQTVTETPVQAGAETLVLEDGGAGEDDIRFYRVKETLTAG